MRTHARVHAQATHPSSIMALSNTGGHGRGGQGGRIIGGSLSWFGVGHGGVVGALARGSGLGEAARAGASLVGLSHGLERAMAVWWEHLRGAVGWVRRPGRALMIQWVSLMFECAMNGVVGALARGSGLGEVARAGASLVGLTRGLSTPWRCGCSACKGALACMHP